MDKNKIMSLVMSAVIIAGGTALVSADEIGEVKASSETGIVIEEYQEAPYKTATVKDGKSVNVRIDGSVKRVAKEGEQFKVIGIQGEWLNVEDGEDEAWISSEFVDISEGVAFTTASTLNLRAADNTSAEVIEELDKGSALTVVKKEGDWLQVRNRGTEGYVHADYVTDEAPIVPSVDVNGNVIDVPSADSYSVQAVLNLAYSKKGSPYLWGSTGPDKFDCSGFTSYVFRNAVGVSLPRVSRDQANVGTEVSRDQLQAGDLVFFATDGTGNVSHVGIYVGNGCMIHAPHSGDVVKVTSIDSDYYTSHFVTARRVL
ncbi:C40 family peptidase [Peptacetobacter hominis]|uniref:C40 family peptidase n=1 Tax=Peptacetobacter hominis TaxID=2743610 RepID=UPI001582D687|nr:NlpC/P60 family protein [Peptacetobacter hominis]